MNESLCQDCLRPQPGHPANKGRCVCGGETCGCTDCLETLRKPIASWSESEGCQTQEKGR